MFLNVVPYPFLSLANSLKQPMHVRNLINQLISNCSAQYVKQQSLNIILSMINGTTMKNLLLNYYLLLYSCSIYTTYLYISMSKLPYLNLPYLNITVFWYCGNF